MHIKRLVIVFLLLSWSGFSQSVYVGKVTHLEKKYQDCLDNGINMSGCSGEYYRQVDNLLNEVYKKISEKSSSVEQQKLKTIQLKWRKERDVYFKKAYSEAKEEAEGLRDNDVQMIFNDKKAEYVKAQVLLLIAQYKV